MRTQTLHAWVWAHRPCTPLALGNYGQLNAQAESFAYGTEVVSETPRNSGVAPNKFLAKLASDWRKPDELVVIQARGRGFVSPALVGVTRAWGGKITGERLAIWGKEDGCESCWLDPKLLPGSALLVQAVPS